jgi:hypothetical protein
LNQGELENLNEAIDAACEMRDHKTGDRDRFSGALGEAGGIL